MQSSRGSAPLLMRLFGVLVVVACAQEELPPSEPPAGASPVAALELSPWVAAPGDSVAVTARLPLYAEVEAAFEIEGEIIAATVTPQDDHLAVSAAVIAPATGGDHRVDLQVTHPHGVVRGSALLHVSHSTDCAPGEVLAGGRCAARTAGHTIQLDRFMHWGFMYYGPDGELTTDRDMSHPRAVVPFGDVLVGCFSEAVGITRISDLLPAAAFGDEWALQPPVLEDLIEPHGLATCNDIAVSPDQRFAVAASRGDSLPGGLAVWALPPLDGELTPPALTAAYPLASGFESVRFLGDTLIATGNPNRVVTYRLTDTGELELLHDEVIPELGAGWGIAVDGERFYVTDAGTLHEHGDGSLHHHSGGALLVMTLQDGRPRLLGRVETAGAARDAAILPDAVVAVAAGPAGVELFDVSDPAAPWRLSGAGSPGSVMSLSYDDGLLLAATWDGARLYDAAERGRLRLLDTTDGLEEPVGGLEGFLSHAITRYIRTGYHVQLFDDVVVVAEIDRLFAGRVHRGAEGPRLSLLDRKITLPAGGRVTRALRVANGGRSTVWVDVAPGDEHVTSVNGPVVLAPDAVDVLEVAVDGVTSDRWLDLVSNDASGFPLQVSLLTRSGSYGELDPAPDFSLPVVVPCEGTGCRDPGQCFELKETLKEGRPVVIAFFSSW